MDLPVLIARRRKRDIPLFLLIRFISFQQKICGSELPDRVPFEENAFDIGLSSHFLLMYTSLGYEFHIQAIREMLRVCREVRIFPMVDLDGEKTGLAEKVLSFFAKSYSLEIQNTEYEFQKGGNKLLIIKK